MLAENAVFFIPLGKNTIGTSRLSANCKLGCDFLSVMSKNSVSVVNLIRITLLSRKW